MKLPEDKFELIQRDAENGVIQAQLILGWGYLKGNGQPKNYEKALYWYNKAAEQGDVVAQNTLRVMYQDGLGIPRDLSKAVAWAKKAAHGGHIQCLVNLGSYYLKGLGVQRDPAVAYTLMRIAEAYGFRHWRQTLVMYIVQRGLTQTQMKWARDNLIVWKLKHQQSLPEEMPEFLKP